VAILKNAPTMKPGAACIDSVTATYFRSDGSDKFLIGDFYGKRPIDPIIFRRGPLKPIWKTSSKDRRAEYPSWRAPKLCEE